jgi:hypothetical protein
MMGKNPLKNIRIGCRENYGRFNSAQVQILIKILGWRFDQIAQRHFAVLIAGRV